MLLELTLKILKDVLENTALRHVELQDALNLVYCDEEKKEYPDEFDLVFHENISHSAIQAIDDLLAAYDYIEMRFRDGKLEIFQREKPKEA